MPVVISFIMAVIAWRSFGNKIIRPVGNVIRDINESNKIDFLDNEANVKSSLNVTQKYTGPKKGTVQIGKFRVGIIPIIIVALLLIKKLVR
jgi:hypothetical protein